MPALNLDMKWCYSCWPRRQAAPKIHRCKKLRAGSPPPPNRTWVTRLTDSGRLITNFDYNFWRERPRSGHNLRIVASYRPARDKMDIGGDPAGPETCGSPPPPPPRPSPPPPSRPAFPRHGGDPAGPENCVSRPSPPLPLRHSRPPSRVMARPPASRW